MRHEKHIINKDVYVALGINAEGKKDVLGILLSENEGDGFTKEVIMMDKQELRPLFNMEYLSDFLGLSNL